MHTTQVNVFFFPLPYLWFHFAPKTAVFISFGYGRKIQTKSFRLTPLAFNGCMVCLKKFGSILSLFQFWFHFPPAFHVACLAAFLATVQVTLFLFARLERSRTPTLNACRAIAPFGHRTQIVNFPLPSPAFLRAAFAFSLSFEHLHASLLCTIPAPRGGISDFFFDVIDWWM